MSIDILQVPYDSGHRAVRMGAGPLRLVAAGLPRHLIGLGHDVRVVPIELPAAFTAEIAAGFELANTIRARVADARERGAFPLLLAGNCIASLGAVAALGQPSVFWFDAHGDLNTPETTRSGFLDGMALAILLGRCWTSMSGRVGLEAVPEARVWLLNTRALDPPEALFLAGSQVRTSLDGALHQDDEQPAYLHIDLDVLDPSVAIANQFAVPGGLALADLLALIDRIAASRRIGAAALTAYDPAADPEGAMIGAAFRIAERIAAAASL